MWRCLRQKFTAGRAFCSASWTWRKKLRWEEVLATLEEASRRGATFEEAMSRFQGQSLDSFVVRNVVRRVNNVELATKFFNWSCRQEGCHNDVFSYTSMLNELVRARKFDEALSFFKLELCRHCRPNLVSFRVVIKGLCYSGNPTQAWRYLGYMKSLGELPDATTYNMILKAYSDAGRVGKTLMKLGKMARHCRPDVVTYNTVINGLCKFGRIDWAVFLFERMTGTENISYSHEGDKTILMYKPMFQSLPQELVQPDGFTYSTLIHGLCQAERMDAALQVYDMMLKSFHEADAPVYNAMADGLCKARRVDEALEILKTMMQKGCRPTVVTYNCVITGVCNFRDRVDEAYRLFQQMIGSDCPPNTITYSAMIYGLSKKYKVSECIRLFNEMLNDGFQPNRYTYHALIYACVRIQSVKRAKAMFLDAKSRRIGPDVYMYTTLMTGYCRHPGGPRIEEALHLFRNMKESSCWPNVITYNCLLRGLCRGRRFDEAYELFQEMFKVKCYPNRMTFKIMTQGMVKSGKTEKFEQIFMDMVYKGRWQGQGPLLEQHGLMGVTDEKRREFFLTAAASKEGGNPVEAILKGKYY